MKKFLTNDICKKIGISVIMLAIMLCSVFIVSKFATSPEYYKGTMQSIDDKKATVMGITAGAATTSTILAAFPGDVTTPIANQIMQISSYLMIVVCVLVLEKSVLTVMGYLAFNILVPIACVLFGIHTFIRKEFLKTIALKFVIFAMVIVTIIPLSVKIGDLICDSNSVYIEQVTEESIEENTEKNTGEGTLDESWSDGIINKFKEGAAYAGNYAKEKLNNFIDAIAIFIIAYCAIPIIVIVFVVWFFNFLFGLKIPVNSKILRKRTTGNENRTNVVSEQG